MKEFPNVSLVVMHSNMKINMDSNKRVHKQTNNKQTNMYQAWDREKSKKEENCYMWGSAATEPPGGGFGRGVPPPAENFCNFRYWKSCFNAEKNQKKRKIATCEGAQRPNLLGVGSGGGFPLPQKILQF